MSRTSSAIGGQVDLLVDGEPALVAGEDEQRADEVLGVIDRGADVGRHAAQVGGRAGGVVQHDVDGRAHDRERGAQLMGGVGDEALLALERGLEPVEHLVEGLGQFVEFVAGAAQRDPRRQVVLRGGAGGCGDPVHRAQRAPGGDPAEDRSEGDDHGERDQRVLQQMREGDVALVLRALQLEVRVALGKDAVVGMGAQLLGAAPRQEAGWGLVGPAPAGSSRATRL